MSQTERPPSDEHGAEPWSTPEIALSFQELTGEAASARSGKCRLLRAVAALPLRYAPFFDRLAELWRIPVITVELCLHEAANAQRWRRPWRGFRYLDVPADAALAGRARLLELAPGFRFPRHRHEGAETVLVLEGRYRDADGTIVSAGDCRFLEAGSEHALDVSPDGPCVAAIVQPRLTFTGPILGLLGRGLNRRLR